MTVYEGDDRPDKYGNHPLRFKGYGKISNVYDWLFRNYNGYHFVIVLNCMSDEYVDQGDELLVYFSDTILPELAEIYDYKLERKDRRC